MFSECELIKSIREIENAPPTFQNMQKLATFYTIYDHLYSVPAEPRELKKTVQENVVEWYGDSEFLSLIEDKEAEKMWLLMDELMSTIKALQPRLYEATMQEIRQMV